MEAKENFVTNCLIHKRDDDDGLFELKAGGTIGVYLDGYAIIPMEVYNKLVSDGE